MNKPSMHYGPLSTRPVYERMRGLQVGEQFTLQLRDWKSATPPTDTIGKNRKYVDRFAVRELEEGKGWVITRLK